MKYRNVSQSVRQIMWRHNYSKLLHILNSIGQFEQGNNENQTCYAENLSRKCCGNLMRNTIQWPHSTVENLPELPKEKDSLVTSVCATPTAASPGVKSELKPVPRHILLPLMRRCGPQLHTTLKFHQLKRERKSVPTTTLIVRNLTRRDKTELLFSPLLCVFLNFLAV